MHGVAKARAFIVSSFVAAHSAGAGGRQRAERVQRHRPRHERRGAAGRDGRGQQPGAHREDPRGRHRRRGSLHDHRPPTGDLRRRVHVDRLQHVQARRPGAADQLHHADQRRSARRLSRRVDHGHRRRAGRRRAEHAAHAGAEPRSARRAAERAQLLGPGGADAGRADVEHRRRRQPADGADLHDRARVASDRHDRAGRRPPAEQPDERRPGAGLLQRRGERRGELPDERHRRRRVGRRRPHQHDSEGGRQPCQRLGVRGRHQRQLAGQQRRPRAGRGRLAVGEKVDHISDYNFAHRRADQAGQAVVLHDRPAHRHQRARRQQLLQERRAGHGRSVDLQPCCSA